MRHQSPMVRTITVVSLLLAPLSGGLAVFIAGYGFPPSGEPNLHGSDFTMTREVGDYLAITEQQWKPLLWNYGDFDLYAEVDLSAGAELDLVFRRVEPHPVGDQMPLFHGRFQLLRLSTGRAGPPYRSREEALFAPQLVGGVELMPGAGATVKLEGRGNRVRAFVAGRWFDWVETADDHGSFAFLVRNGNAEVRSLKIEHRERAGRMAPWLWGGAFGFLAGLLVVLLGGALDRWLVALAIPPALAAVTSGWLQPQLLPLISVADAAWIGIGLAGLPLALSLAMRPRRLFWSIPLGLVAGILVLDFGCRAAGPSLRVSEEPLLDAVFQPDSAGAPLEALARRVPGPFEIDAPREVPHRVFYLGGKLLYEPGPPDQNLAVLANGPLRRDMKAEVDGVVLATVDGHAYQQWQLYSTYYQEAFRPQVVVLGITAGEFADQPGGDARARVARLTVPGAPGLQSVPRDPAAGLLGLSGEEWGPRSSPEALRATLAEVRAACSAAGSRLLLLADGSAPVEAVQVLRECAGDGVPLLELGNGASPEESSKRLAEAVVALLR